nr:unnamed protein product [Callosobruchus analis]
MTQTVIVGDGKWLLAALIWMSPSLRKGKSITWMMPLVHSTFDNFNLLEHGVSPQLIKYGGVWNAQHPVNDMDDTVGGCQISLDDSRVDTTSIHRQDYCVDASTLFFHSRVASSGVEEKDAVWYDKCLVNGEIKEFKRLRPKLTPNGVPIFSENVPKYLSQNPSTVVWLADVEQHQMEAAIKESLHSFKAYKTAKIISTVRSRFVFQISLQ